MKSYFSMIRHKYICADKKNIADKFRIQIFDLNKKFNGYYFIT